VCRLLAILLLALVGVLPPIDAFACPDGCSDTVHSAASWEHGERCSAAAGCGLCFNASYVRRDAAPVIRLDRIAAMPIFLPRDLMSVEPSPIERPPLAV
jgi:hypothetical protein